MANPALNKLLEESGGSRYSGLDSGSTVTIDSVVQKTAVCLGVLVLFAGAMWFYLNNLIADGDYDAMSRLSPILLVASLSAVGLSFAISFMRKVNVPLILLFAAIEGVVIGAYSKAATLYAGSNEPVVGAVVGTFAALIGTLWAYKQFDIQVTDKMRRITMIAMFSFVAVSLFDLVLHFFGASVGVNGFGVVGVVMSFIGIGIALFMLLIDFDSIERAIEMRLPDQEAWRLSFGLMVTLIWLYVNLLRIFSFFSSD